MRNIVIQVERERKRQTGRQADTDWQRKSKTDRQTGWQKDRVINIIIMGYKNPIHSLRLFFH